MIEVINIRYKNVYAQCYCYNILNKQVIYLAEPYKSPVYKSPIEYDNLCICTPCKNKIGYIIVIIRMGDKYICVSSSHSHTHQERRVRGGWKERR